MAQKQGLGLRAKIIKTAFSGQHDFLNMITTYAGTPNSALTAAFQGQLCLDTTDGDDVYMNTDGATTWTKVYD